MSGLAFKKVAFYFRTEVKAAKFWENKLARLLKKRFTKIQILASNAVPRQKKSAPELLIVLGGDGTILEAAQKFQRWNPRILGLNLGHVGFLASVRNPKNFVAGLFSVLRRKYRVVPHMMMRAVVERRGKRILSGYALNEIAVQNLSGVVDIEVYVDEHCVQKIHGSGVLVSTATGSTAYNLSAHGPIVMPDIKCFIITELMDHSLPTPSLVIKRDRTITVKIGGFRKSGRFLLQDTKEPVDVMLSTDTERALALRPGDRIIIKKSERLVRFLELEKNYFFKSLQEKFAFR
ncbi:MAG: NAD(+)/NADH kinase [Candidatus Sungiibacteriota bacterium]|uniref:NAD kinase n=1 Tax=Candidatus Sungiibacteriota bacterium TaxID=2750080 RepID=A0A7T5RJA0_9BACT|nr:MAG: NAD(+)/NADH kinase [Candidatus Sungbacteria bacterium]